MDNNESNSHTQMQAIVLITKAIHTIGQAVKSKTNTSGE